MMIASGLLVGQGAVYLSTPLLSRMYSPDEIGTAAAVMAAGGIIGAVAALRFELMLPGAPDEEVRWVARRAGLLLVVSSVLLSPIAGLVLSFSPIDVMLTALTAIGIGGVALSMQTASRVQVLRGVAIAKAVQGVGQTAVQIALAVPAGAIGMQSGAALGLLTASGVQTLSSRRRIRALPAAKPSPSRIRTMIRRALVLTVAAAFNAAVVSSLPLLTTLFYGEAATGELAVAQRLALAPTGLVVAAVLPVVITQFGTQRRDDRTASRALVVRWLRRLVPLGAAATILLLGASMLPLEVMLGAEWDGVGAYVAAMAPLIGAQLIAGPLAQCLVIQERERAQLLWDVCRLVAVVAAAAIVMFLGGDAIAMVWVVSGVLSAAYAIYLWLVLAGRWSRRS